MSERLDYVMEELKSDGLHVTHTSTGGLFIAASIEVFDNGLQILQDACKLSPDSEQWVAVFFAGQRYYAVHGQLSELVLLIKKVYSNFREGSEKLYETFARVVENHKEYLR